MLKRPTLSVAAPVARALTEYNLVLAPKSDHYPVGIMAGHIRAAVDPDYKQLTNDRAMALNDLVRRSNEVVGEREAEEFDELTTLMAQGLGRMLKTVRGVVVPFCKTIKAAYDQIGEHSRVPKLEVKPFVFHSIHEDASLSTHILEQYCNVRQRDSYRTFIMDCPSMETLIEWITANKHVDGQETAEWLASLQDQEEELRITWYELFGDRRELHPSDLPMANRGKLPFTTDRLLVAYFLTAYLCHEPQDVAGESVSIDEWEGALGQLHTLFGSLLCQAYQFRARARQQKRVVFRYDVEKQNEGQSVTVWANGDVYADWLEAGGSVKQLLGAAVMAPTRLAAKDLDAVKEDLETQWDRKHYLLRQAALDRYLSKRRDTLRTLLIHRPTGDDAEDEAAGSLPEIGYNELVTRVTREVKALREDDLDDPWRTITALVCNVYYPNTPYREFLLSMDRITKTHPDMPARELATLATVEMTAQWLVKQIRSESFVEDIRNHDEGSEVVPEENPAAEVEPESPVAEEASDVTTEEEDIVESEEADEAKQEAVEDDATVSA